jgi:hypothetical protein
MAKLDDHHQQHVSQNFPEPGICVSDHRPWPCDAARAVGALKAVLKLHTLTGYVCRMERCPQHRSFGWGWDVCRACPNCVLIEREGCCDRCRDENGDPARAEECKERQAISGKLLRASNSGEGSGG